MARHLVDKVNIQNFMKLCNDLNMEKLNLKMCKYLLGVHRKSTNDAVRGELGRYPLLIKILNYSYRYFQNLQSSSTNSLVKLSCLDNDLRTLEQSWYNCMNRLVTNFNHSRSFLTDMQNVYRISWENLMKSCTGKLRTYSEFKTDFTLENYILQFPMHIRRNLTKLRISAHSLAIETGRYSNQNSNKPTQIEKRTCFHCNKIESEFHLVFECTLYDTERKLMFDQLNNFTLIPHDPTKENFNTLMSCLNGDLEVGRTFCEYINNCFEIRKECLFKTKEKNILLRPETTTTRSGRISIRPTRIDL